MTGKVSQTDCRVVKHAVEEGVWPRPAWAALERKTPRSLQAQRESGSWDANGGLWVGRPCQPLCPPLCSSALCKILSFPIEFTVFL